VVFCSFLSGNMERVAEFLWSPEAGVTLTILDAVEERGSGLARKYYETGIDSVREGRMVSCDEGAIFMRALLEPRRMSYFAFRDESNRT
jgi:hypothetical protein